MIKASGYSTPKFRYGEVVIDEVRGEVVIVGLTDGLIPWPIGKKGRAKTFIVYRDLAKAIRAEANATVCELWGITPQTVTKWRKALGVEQHNAGTVRRLSENMTAAKKGKMRKARATKDNDPVRIEKIRQSKLGKPRPKRVLDRLRAANIGRKWTDAERTRQMERRKQLYPASYRPWTAEEDQLVMTLTIQEVAERTGRPHGRIAQRRRDLGIMPYEQPAVRNRD